MIRARMCVHNFKLNARYIFKLLNIYINMCLLHICVCIIISMIYFSIKFAFNQYLKKIKDWFELLNPNT